MCSYCSKASFREGPQEWLPFWPKKQNLNHTFQKNIVCFVFVNRIVDICGTIQCLQFLPKPFTDVYEVVTYVRRFLCLFLVNRIFVETKMASHILKRILISSRSVPAILPIASRNFSRSAAALAPQVQHPAPTFKTQAVVNGAFKEISLEVICLICLTWQQQQQQTTWHVM